MKKTKLEQLREEINGINLQLLELLSRRAEVAREIGKTKDKLGLQVFDPKRESVMLRTLLANNHGPFSDATVTHLFRQIYEASADLIRAKQRSGLTVHREAGDADQVVDVGGVQVGGGGVSFIAGPCSVENEEQLDRIAAFLSGLGVKLLRGGAFKPRTSPYSFQGLRHDGIAILRRVADRYGMKIVTEVMDTRDVDRLVPMVDVLQVGARSMQNFELLRLVGQTQRPVLLKRGMMATMEELILAAEYIAMEGNRQILLCERGIRTFERWTRNTLDISAIPILKQEVPFPIVADLSHSTGRRDIVGPLSRAVIAAGADAIMVEVHDAPAVALSDSAQQLDLDQFGQLHREICRWIATDRDTD